MSANTNGNCGHLHFAGHKDPAGSANALTIMASIIDFQELLKKEREKFKKEKLPRQSKRTISIRTASNESTQGETKSAKQIYTGLLEEINGNLDRQSLRQAIKLNKNVKVRNLNDFKVMDRRVDGLYYIPNVLEESSYNSILEIINSSNSDCWKELKTRKLQIWGGHVGVDESGSAVPNYLAVLAEEINKHLHIFNVTEDCSSDESPNHFLINHYQVGEGILPHQDGPSYLPKVVILSLQESCVFSFYKYIPPESNARRIQPPVASLCLRPNSLLYFTGEAYCEYLHSIAAVTEERIDSQECGITLNKKEAYVTSGQNIARTKSRISLTIRKVFWPSSDCRAKKS